MGKKKKVIRHALARTETHMQEMINITDDMETASQKLLNNMKNAGDTNPPEGHAIDFDLLIEEEFVDERKPYKPPTVKRIDDMPDKQGKWTMRTFMTNDIIDAMWGEKDRKGCLLQDHSSELVDATSSGMLVWRVLRDRADGSLWGFWLLKPMEWIHGFMSMTDMTGRNIRPVWNGESWKPSHEKMQLLKVEQRETVTFKPQWRPGEWNAKKS